jgi:alpha-methylacyl-CoA racemase
VGPLKGIKIVEIASIGPGPFCAMMLADMGAEVIRIERKGAPPVRDKRFNVLARGRRAIALDLKQESSVSMVLRLVEQADALIEGFRPGVMERLGLGPDVCRARNKTLVYGRMTGWGQSGPLRDAAGHDINYIALSGALHSIGLAGGGPVPPLNLVGDFGGGGLLLAFGIVCGILEARKSGQGQIVDAAMTEGAALLMSIIYGLHSEGSWSNERGHNLLDSGSHFYNTYQCADDKWVAIGSIEPQFYALLLEKAGLHEISGFPQMDKTGWSVLKEKVAAAFRKRTRDEWCALMEGTDVCFAPVLDMDEAPKHVHNAARGAFVEIDGVVQPSPAPRFSRTVAEVQKTPEEEIEEALRRWNLSDAEIAELRRV